MASSASGSAARQGFWAAIALAILFLAASWVSPIAGGSGGLIALACAWGIRRGNPWAAIAALVFIAAPVVPALRSDWRSVGVTALAEALFVFLFFRAARELWREPAHRHASPWAAAAALAALFWIACSPYAVSAGSMEQTLLRGDRIVVESATWTLGRSPQTGDVVVIRYPVDERQRFIKRVVGLPGDRIQIRDKRLYRNGQPVDEAYAIHTASGVEPVRDNFPTDGGEVVVADGRYFVLGDNRDDSLDSRYWGFITRRQIVGSPVLIYDSYETGSPAPSRIRWRRLLTMVR